MISVLIPVYNVVCLNLVERVHSMLVNEKISFEILLSDNASDSASIREQNRCVENWNNCRYFQQEKNLGPAGNRNFLAEQAKFPYLLFLDTDVMPVKDDFIKKYVHEALPGGVVCGGFMYSRHQVPSFAKLRYRYGIEIEEKNAAVRSSAPYNCFISMNFMIAKEIFMQIRFDETFRMGYEDTCFGLQLQRRAVPIKHIDNPVYHLVEEDSETYLRKIRCSVRNLKGHEDEMRHGVKLLRWYFALKRMHLVMLVAIIFQKTEKELVKQLTSSSPSLKLFAFYKLGYLCAFMQERNTLGQ